MAGHAGAAIELGACRIINIKLGRVGGFSEARRVHDCAAIVRFPVWCGGMLESGIGRAHNIAMSTLRDSRYLAMSPQQRATGLKTSSSRKCESRPAARYRSRTPRTGICSQGRPH